MYNIKRNENEHVLEQHCTDGMEYLSFPQLDSTGIVRHLISTRIGGASKGCYAETNFSYTRGDRKEDVDENYRRVSSILGHGRSLNDFVCTYQTHTTNIRVADERDRGKGTAVSRDYVDVDGLVTNVPGLILTSFYADCTPVMALDPVNRAIGIVHSGWRGTAGRIAKKLLVTMKEEYGTNPKDCICCIAPSICGDCYEIGSEVADIFKAEFGKDAFDKGMLKEKGNDKFLLNLWKCNEYILGEAGAEKKNIITTDICTHCNPDYLFSHRTQGNMRGNLAAFITLV